MAADFTVHTDLASRALGGSVMAANDEAFAERANLVNPGPAEFSTTSYGHQGKVYDGWETRRRREPGHDWAVIRLGAPGIIRGIVIDTAWFTGNYPPFASVEALSAEGYPSAADVAEGPWETIVDRAAIAGGTENRFPVTSERRYTHVRLTIYPDGGVARLRVHGEVVVDPRLLPSAVDFAALETGGTVSEYSDGFYTSPTNLIQPGRIRTTAEGWENARRRDDGNDFVVFALATTARLTLAELDTSRFVHNAPGEVALSGRDPLTGEWVPLLPRQPLQPDARQVFRLTAHPPISHVRMDVYPDGGLARVRLFGDLDEASTTPLLLAWFNALPAAHAELVLGQAGADPRSAARLVAARPLASLHPDVAALL